MASYFVRRGLRFTALAAVLCLTACASLGGKVAGTDGIERAKELGLKLDPPEIDLKTSKIYLPEYSKQVRDDYTHLWMRASDELCGPYKSKIIAVSRDSRIAPDLLATVLGGLATIFTPAATVRALAGAAAITSAGGAVFQSDTFNGQVGEILTAAIETARRNQANQIRKNLRDQDVSQYSLYAALRDVTDYHDMCSLNTALIQVRVSLQLTSPDGGLTPPAKQGQQETGGIGAVAQAIVTSANAPLPRPPSRPPGVTAITSRPTQMTLIQRAICAPQTGVLGPPGSDTRRAIGMYLGRPSTAAEPSPSEMEELFKAVDIVGDCEAKGFLNAYEVARYGVSNGRQTIAGLQSRLARKLSADPPLVASGQLDKPTRDAITEVRKKACQNSKAGSQLDRAFDLWLLQNPRPFTEDPTDGAAECRS